MTKLTISQKNCSGAETVQTARRIVLKIGSALMQDAESGTVRQNWLAGLAGELACRQKEGQQFILVSSGAVALGSRALGLAEKPKRQDLAQAAAAVGQVHLLNAYQAAFQPYDLCLAQLLLTLDNFEDRLKYLNARQTTEALLGHGIIPIINENDPIADQNAGFGDNDRLAARIAQLVGADVLVLLSDIDGLYDRDPDEGDAVHIPFVPDINDTIRKMAGPPKKGGKGSGGMRTKILAADIATASGAAMIIMQGKPEKPLSAVEAGVRHTLFPATGKKLSVRKSWLKSLMTVKGSLTLDQGAVKAIGQGNSLLPAGILQVDGRFSRGDLVALKTLEGVVIAQGLVSYDVRECRIVRGAKMSDVPDLLGYDGRSAIIHTDDLVLDDAVFARDF